MGKSNHAVIVVWPQRFNRLTSPIWSVPLQEMTDKPFKMLSNVKIHSLTWPPDSVQLFCSPGEGWSWHIIGCRCLSIQWETALIMALILWWVQMSVSEPQVSHVCLRWISSETSVSLKWVRLCLGESLVRLLYVSGEFQVCLRSSAKRHAFAVLLHQWHQAAGRASLQQERVLQQADGTGSLFCVTSQHAVQEVLQHRGHLNTEGHHKQEWDLDKIHGGPWWRSLQGFYVRLYCCFVSIFVIIAHCKIWIFLDHEHHFKWKGINKF